MTCPVLEPFQEGGAGGPSGRRGGSGSCVGGLARRWEAGTLSHGGGGHGAGGQWSGPFDAGPGAGRTAASGRAGRCRGCSCTRRPRHAWLAGRPPLDLVVTLDDATSEGLLGHSGRGRGHRVELPGAGRGDRARAVLRALHRPRQPLFPHAGGRRPGRPAAPRPRSAGRWRSSASSTSPPIRRRRAGARSGPSARCRTGCRRSWRSPGSPTIEAANRWLREVYLPEHNARFAVTAEEPAPPSCRWRPRNGARCSASRRTARSATTTRVRWPAAAGGRAPSGASGVTAATRPGPWICGQCCALPTTPPAHNSGQLMRSYGGQVNALATRVS